MSFANRPFFTLVLVLLFSFFLSGGCFTNGSAPGDSTDGGSTTTENSSSLCEDRCGDGVCQEVVCMGEGCPCAESPKTCPADCTDGH